MEKFLKGENKQSNKCLKRKTSITKLNINTRIKKKEMGSANITQTRLRETEGGGGFKKRRWFVHDLDH